MLLTLVSAGALLAPAAAQAGTVGVPASSETPSRNCSSPCTGRYTITAPSAGAEFTVDPVSGRQFSNGEAGWVDLPSGFDEWEYTGRAQGHRVILDFPGSNTRQEWGIVVCRPAAPSENRVCAGNAPIVPWMGSPVAYDLPTPGMRVRAVLRYGGSSGNAAVAGIILRGRAAWVAVDNEPPALTALLAGRPLGDGMVIGGGDEATGRGAELTVEATDNIGEPGFDARIDSSPLTLADGLGRVPDGRRTVTARACDVSSPANCTERSAKVTIDTARPIVSLPPLTASREERPEITVEARDPETSGFASGITSFALQIGEQKLDADVERDKAVARLRPREPLPEGRYPLAVLATDGAGNTNDPGDGRELVVDRTPPSVAPALPIPKTTVRDRPESVVATATDNIGFASATLLVDGGAVPAEYDDLAGRLAWYPEGGLCPGRHTVEAIGTDLAGQTDRTRWSFRVRGEQTAACRRQSCLLRRSATKRAARAVVRARKSLRAARRYGTRKRIVRAKRTLRVKKRTLSTARRTERRICRR
ncbi:MAG: hypothetical protein JHC84_08465 [Solirubrobacteraceae bacterium]|nr:hypothetical protein [Solirubrobacteraceae bacterium]